MGIAGELSFVKTREMGTGSFHIGIIDALSNMNSTYFCRKGEDR